MPSHYHSYKYTTTGETFMTDLILELGKEYPPADEQVYIDKIAAISQTSMLGKPHPPTLRDQHPKSHGYLQGEFTVPEGIDERLRVGIFKEPKTYPIWIRFSNGNGRRNPQTGKLLSDTEGDARGMAIKVLGIDGKTILDHPGHEHEQDFVLINHPNFFIKNVKDYLDFFVIMGAINQGKIVLGNPPQIPAELQQTFANISYCFTILGEIKQKVIPSPLEIKYWSSTPYKLGDYAIKFAAFPHPIKKKFSPDKAWWNQENYLREALTEQLYSEAAYFEFMMQLQTNPNTMKVEDGTALWDENESPFLRAAVIKIPMQNFNTPERLALDENQSFSPWHSLPEHQPLGGINRARKMYSTLADVRSDRH
jgi:catalase